MVLFLYTIVRHPYANEYNNLERVIKYVQGTIGLPLILEIDKYGNIKWYVDAEFLVHKDMRSHTGGFMTMGTGGAFVRSRIKIKSSTEANLFVVDDFLTQVIWTQ